MREFAGDAILLVSFGGPDRPDEVMPFLENVLRGRNVPRERMLEVAKHYYHFGGRSPINDQNRALLAALQQLLAAEGPDLPVYWGNRNWHPLLADTVRQMTADGVRRAFAFVTSAYSSYSGCRQYLEDLARAAEAAGPGAPEVLKLRVFYNHPGFIEPMAERVRTSFECIPAERRAAAALAFSAHSVPVDMAETSRYVAQVEEACRLVAERAGHPSYRLVYQSRSGAPGQPWLGPDVLEYLRELAAAGATRDVVLAPIGFISDHMEVVYDLDTEARRSACELGLHMVRAETVGADSRFVAMIRELVLERIAGAAKRALGEFGPNHDVCPEDCCPPPKGMQHP
ncbi:MAG TPA: ferrochelatase [Bryobacteraceae bacterium]|jgi:ferrochelatase|nr:ferrochelatase [Bryobacteraceae bacterium]